MAPTRRRDASGLWWHCEEDEWYAASLAHWSASEGADVLGGCEGVAEADLSGSLDFLRSVAGWAVQGEPVQGSCAMDVGAGCGRVTEGVLLHAFEHVHMVEVSADGGWCDATCRGRARARMTSRNGREQVVVEHNRGERKSPPVVLGYYSCSAASCVMQASSLDRSALQRYSSGLHLLRCLSG